MCNFIFTVFLFAIGGFGIGAGVAFAGVASPLRLLLSCLVLASSVLIGGFIAMSVLK